MPPARHNPANQLHRTTPGSRLDGNHPARRRLDDERHWLRIAPKLTGHMFPRLLRQPEYNTRLRADGLTFGAGKEPRRNFTGYLWPVSGTGWTRSWSAMWPGSPRRCCGSWTIGMTWA
jgi:hypothetical protein